MRYATNDLIEVQWFDAEIVGGWVSQSTCTVSPNTLFKTVGYFTYIDEDFLIISPTIGLGRNTKRGKISIPLGSIKNIETIDRRSKWREEKPQD